MGAGRSDCDGIYILTDEAGEEHRKTKAMICTPRLIRGK